MGPPAPCPPRGSCRTRIQLQRGRVDVLNDADAPDCGFVIHHLVVPVVVLAEDNRIADAEPILGDTGAEAPVGLVQVVGGVGVLDRPLAYEAGREQADATCSTETEPPRNASSSLMPAAGQHHRCRHRSRCPLRCGSRRARRIAQSRRPSGRPRRTPHCPGSRRWSRCSSGWRCCDRTRSCRSRRLSNVVAAEHGACCRRRGPAERRRWCRRDRFRRCRPLPSRSGRR